MYISCTSLSTTDAQILEYLKFLQVSSTAVPYARMSAGFTVLLPECLLIRSDYSTVYRYKRREFA